MTYKSLDEIKNLVGAFEDCTLLLSEWKHSAHLTVALWYLIHFIEYEVINCLRDRIPIYNAAHGIKNTKDSGYHETITLFWVQIITWYLSANAGDNNIVLLTNKLIDSYGNSRLTLEYYSFEKLTSREARIIWLEPDLKHLK